MLSKFSLIYPSPPELVRSQVASKSTATENWMVFPSISMSKNANSFSFTRESSPLSNQLSYLGKEHSNSVIFEFKMFSVVIVIVYIISYTNIRKNIGKCKFIILQKCLTYYFAPLTHQDSFYSNIN